MSSFLDSEIATAFYRTRDAIKNLKIKVQIERATSTTILSQAVIDKECEGNTELRSERMKQNYGSNKDIEEYTFHWQEKLFSKREVDKYSNLQGENLGFLEKKYQEKAKNLNESGRPTKLLFSFVEVDGITENNEIPQVTTGCSEQPTNLAKRVSHLKHRRGPKSAKRGVVPKSNIVNYEPSTDMQKRNQFANSVLQTMYLMADLTPSGREPSEADECVLCTINYHANGILSLKPNFNENKRPYKVEAAELGGDVYEYRIIHASKQLSRQEQDKENKMFQELYSRHSDFISSCVGYQFEMLPPDTYRTVFLSEIVSASNFEYDNLYIRYHIKLPKDWYLASESNLTGVTQTCSTKTVNRDQVAYFSYPIHLDIYYKKSIISTKSDSDEVLPQWPVMYLQVLSLDSWNRSRTEGYGYLNLPLAPGELLHTVNCWRPTGRTVVSNLRRFFIGGSPELEDLSYMAIPSSFEGDRLSKFGFSTQSTGTITVKLHSIHQSQSLLERKNEMKQKSSNLALKLLGAPASTNFKSIVKILDTFKAAKTRMIEARDNLKRDYVETLKPLNAADEDVEDDQ